MSTQARTYRRATRPAGPPAPPECTCRRLVLGKLVDGGKPWLIATFRPARPGRDAELVSVERYHLGGCRMPIEHLDPREYARSSG